MVSGLTGGSPRAVASSYSFLAPPQAPGELGRLGPYRVLGVLGAGGMGIVFRAEDTQLRRPVALKVLAPELNADPANRQRFLREARAAAALKGDHVVTVHQVGEDRGLPYMALELLEGETLETRLRRAGRLPTAEVLRIGREICEGLAAAHERGLVHRDVKPANVWLEAPRGRVKLLDFGLALAARGDPRLTQSGAVVGTPAYLAPEQARGGTPDPRSDLFSLGCVLYRACTGQLPFRGSDTLAVLTALAVENPTPVRQLNPELPLALGDLVMRLLSKAPAARPKSARAVIEAIDAIGEAPPTSRPGQPASAPVSAVVEGEPWARTEAVPAVPVRPRRPLFLALGIVGLFVLSALGLTIAGLWYAGSHAAAPDQRSGAGRPSAVESERWTVLFRADDPSLWNTDTRGERFAVPLREAPASMRYLRLRRMDTKEALILPLTRAQLHNRRVPRPDNGYWWNGSAKEDWKGLHLGIAQGPRYRFPAPDNMIVVMNENFDCYAGSGFGHKCFVNDGQYYCWRGKEIPRTVFEIAVSEGPLSDEESRGLLTTP